MLSRHEDGRKLALRHGDVPSLVLCLLHRKIVSGDRGGTHGRARTGTTDTNITPHPPTKTKYRAAKREASARRKQRRSPAKQHRSDATRAVAPRRSATPKAPGPDVRAQARREHARVHGPAVRRTRRTAQPLDHPGRHADEGQPGDAKVRSRANRCNAPRAPQPTGEEAVRLSRRACAHRSHRDDT